MTALPVASGRRSSAAVLRAAASHPRDWIPALVWTIGASAATVGVPLLLGALVDAVQDHHRGDLVGLIVALAVVGGAGAVTGALATRSVERLGARVAADLRERVVERVLALPAPTVEAAGHGDVTARVTDDVDQLIDAMPLVAEVVAAGGVVLAAVASFTALNWRLTLAFATVLPLYAVSLWWYLPRAQRSYARERARAADRGRVLLESLSAKATIDAYDMAELQADRVADASAAARDTGLHASRLSLWLTKTANIAEAVGLSMILLTGYFLVHDGSVSIGDVTAAALLFHRLFDPLGTVLDSVDEMQRAGAALARIVGVPATSASAPSRPAAGPVDIAARELGHSYDGARTVLHDVNLTIPAGSSLGVVGTSGAGKSTLAVCLAGLLQASSGTVLLDDGSGPQPLAGPTAHLRAWVGMVSQEVHVFAGSLRADLTLAAPGSSDDQLWAALRLAHAHTWVAQLPAGLDTVIGRGGHPLSAAQAQQLALARLALRDPPVVILDEATAEAGSAGAAELDHAAAAVLAGRTALVVAHRLSQAAACDAIAVMADGTIVEQGTHDELIAAAGHYAQLWASWQAEIPERDGTLRPHGQEEPTAIS